MIKKIKVQKRISNRTYPSKLCKKEGCYVEFIPTDGRQVYCCSQHRIDSNNDKRKIVDKFESEFKTKAKKNRFVLKKISESAFYINENRVSKNLLIYEGYEFPIYHKKVIDKETNREILVCYEYGLILVDTNQKLYEIVILENIK